MRLEFLPLSSSIKKELCNFCERCKATREFITKASKILTCETCLEDLQALFKGEDYAEDEKSL